MFTSEVLSEAKSLLRRGAMDVLTLLDEGKEPLRFTQIYEKRKKIFRNHATLAHRLRELERTGFIQKNVETNPGNPVSIFYVITETGEDVIPILKRFAEEFAKVNKSETPV